LSQAELKGWDRYIKQHRHSRSGFLIGPAQPVLADNGAAMRFTSAARTVGKHCSPPANERLSQA
jgi:hypothetical protein